MLQVQELTKHFGGLIALENVNIDINKKEILGVIGPNGAGKTTLFNAISGFYPPTSGKVIFNGRDITNLRADQVAQVGISRTFQAATLYKNISVIENVFTGFHMAYKTSIWKRILHTTSALQEEREFRQKAEEILKFMGLDSLKDELAGSLCYGHQKILSICIALANSPRLLLLDEPVAGMNQTEMQTMIGLIRRIRDSGITIAVVEHNMKVVMNICDRVVVLNYGQKIAEGLPCEILENKEVIKAYLGRKGVADVA